MCRLIILNINIKVNYIINLLLIFNLISEDGSKDRLTDVLSIQTTKLKSALIINLSFQMGLKYIIHFIQS